jgi:hypothetical protein
MSNDRFAALRATALLFAWATLAGCSSSTSGDSTCVAAPINGAACDPAVPACHPGGGCGTHWTCNSVSHQWSGITSNCVIEPSIDGASPDVGDAASLNDE